MTVSSRARWSLIAVAVSTIGAVGGVAPAVGAPTEYVALGDSYSAGAGAGAYIADGTECYRSTRAYPVLLGVARGVDVNLQACSGAETRDIPAQAAALSTGSSFVTVTIGGNDIGFAPVISACAAPGWLADCTGAVTQARQKVSNELPGRLRTAYAEIRSKAPSARVVVTGYPRLFNGRDCSLLTFFSAAEMDGLNRTGDELNAVLRREAGAAGFDFADPAPGFTGHAVCDADPWINNLRLDPTVESFHPNANGQRGYATSVSTPTVTAARQLDPAAVSPVTPSGSSDARGSGAVTVQDRRGLGEQVTVKVGGATSSDPSRGIVRAPNLRTAAAREAARKAGVDAGELRRIIAAQERGVPNDTLERMSEQAADGAGR